MVRADWTPTERRSWKETSFAYKYYFQIHVLFPFTLMGSALALAILCSPVLTLQSIPWPTAPVLAEG